MGKVLLVLLCGVMAWVTADGRKLANHGAGITDRWDREYFRREGAHLYVTVHANTTLEFQ